MLHNFSSPLLILIAGCYYLFENNLDVIVSGFMVAGEEACSFVHDAMKVLFFTLMFLIKHVQQIMQNNVVLFHIETLEECVYVCVDIFMYICVICYGLTGTTYVVHWF